MIKKITTFMHQIRRDYTFWSVMLAHGNLGSWISQLYTGTAGNLADRTSLNSTNLLPEQNGSQVGCGLNVVMTAGDLDVVWRRTVDQRPPSPTASPFGQAYNTFGHSVINQALMITNLLFGTRDTFDPNGRPMFVDARGQEVSSDYCCTLMCFMYNILNGLSVVQFIEPSHRGDAFWLQIDAGCAPHQALYGLTWIMSVSQNRYAQVHDALDNLAHQISRESWTSSLFSWFAVQQTSSGAGAATVNMNPWTVLARAILLGSPLLAQFVDVEGSVMRSISPYEDPIEFLETSNVGSQVRHVSALSGTHTLARALRPLNTPLSRGCMPPIAVYQLVWDLTSNEVEAKHVDIHELKDQHVDGCYMAFDIRGALQGSHTEIPRDRFPECCILALLSLSIDTPFMQNYVACTREWSATLQQMWPHLQGKFAQRDVETTFRLLGKWEMRDQLPVAREYGTTEWLFTNAGLSISPRARTGAASAVTNQLPRAIVVDGVRLELDTVNTVTVNYRRV